MARERAKRSSDRDDRGKHEQPERIGLRGRFRPDRHPAPPARGRERPPDEKARDDRGQHSGGHQHAPQRGGARHRLERVQRAVAPDLSREPACRRREGCDSRGHEDQLRGSGGATPAPAADRIPGVDRQHRREEKLEVDRRRNEQRVGDGIRRPAALHPAHQHPERPRRREDAQRIRARVPGGEADRRDGDEDPRCVETGLAVEELPPQAVERVHGQTRCRERRQPEHELAGPSGRPRQPHDRDVRDRLGKQARPRQDPAEAAAARPRRPELVEGQAGRQRQDPEAHDHGGHEPAEQDPDARALTARA